MSTESENVDNFISSGDFSLLSARIIGHAHGLSVITRVSRFRVLFGASPTVCPLLCAMLAGSVLHDCEPKHLLWGIMFLKVYAFELAHAALARSGEKTFRKLVVFIWKSMLCVFSNFWFLHHLNQRDQLRSVFLTDLEATQYSVFLLPFKTKLLVVKTVF